MFIFVVQGRESSRQLLEGGPGFGVLQGRLCGSWKRETAASGPLRPPSLAVLTGTLRRTFSLWQMVWVPAVRTLHPCIKLGMASNPSTGREKGEAELLGLVGQPGSGQGQTSRE